MYYLVKTQSKRKVEEIMFDHLHENMQERVTLSNVFGRMFRTSKRNEPQRFSNTQLNYRKGEILMSRIFIVIYVLIIFLLFAPSLLMFVNFSVSYYRFIE
jgi:hypothetical protein